MSILELSHTWQNALSNTSYHCHTRNDRNTLNKKIILKENEKVNNDDKAMMIKLHISNYNYSFKMVYVTQIHIIGWITIKCPFSFPECYGQLIRWISFHVEYALYLLERTHKTELGQKNDQNRTKTDQFTALFIANFRKKNGVTEQSSDFTIIRKIFFIINCITEWYFACFGII